MTKVAVVTGSSYGLGKAITQKLLDKDFKVYGISRTSPYISNPNFNWIKADLLKESSFDLISAQIKEKRIDLLVNNAGTAIRENLLKFNDDDFQKVFSLNFVAPIRLTLALFPRLSSGLVINVSSLSDRFPDGFYGSSKAALNNYFETIALEKNSPKIISILPSYIDTPLLRGLHKNDPDSFWKNVNSPQQTAEFISYVLANPDAIESGSRVVVVNSHQADGDYDPEKLWLFITDRKKLTKLK